MRAKETALGAIDRGGTSDSLCTRNTHFNAVFGILSNAKYKCILSLNDREKEAAAGECSMEWMVVDKNARLANNAAYKRCLIAFPVYEICGRAMQ